MRFSCYDALPIFNKVAEENSFQRAAVRCNLSKGAVSYQIKKIESILGVQLFERRRSGIVLTAAGQTLWDSVRLAYGELDRTLLDLQNVAAEAETQRVSIAMHTYFSSRWLSPRLSQFMVQNPDIALRIEPINNGLDIQSLNVDLAIVWSIDGPPSADAKLIYGSPTYPTAAPSVAKDIEREGFEAVQRRVELFQDSSGDRGWRHWFAHTGRHFRPGHVKLELPDTNSRVQAVIDGQGIALWDSLVQKEIDEGLLCFIFEEGLSNSGFYLVMIGENPTPSTRLFEKWLLDEAEKYSK